LYVVSYGLQLFYVPTDRVVHVTFAVPELADGSSVLLTGVNVHQLQSHASVNFNVLVFVSMTPPDYDRLAWCEKMTVRRCVGVHVSVAAL
jgi:hypothetical protein